MAPRMVKVKIEHRVGLLVSSKVLSYFFNLTCDGSLGEVVKYSAKQSRRTIQTEIIKIL